jgi:hypothetical protein
VAFLMTTTVAAFGKTPDGKPPSKETVCDLETGAAFGLCNAYCEAMDCDSADHHASDTACAQVKSNFEKKTGRPLPCEASCPCVEQIDLFSGIVHGDLDVELCLTDETLLSVVVAGGSFAFVSSDTEPPLCAANLEPPFIALTPDEVMVCRDVLRRAAEAQGVPCVSLE